MINKNCSHEEQYSMLHKNWLHITTFFIFIDKLELLSNILSSNTMNVL